jgi:hypothetical protein
MRIVCFAVLLVASTTVFGQNLTLPPNLLRIQQTAPGIHPAKPGNDVAGIFTIAMSSVAGAAENWSVQTHGSFAAMEEFDANSAPPEDNSRTVIGFYRQWWSHRPEEAMQALRKARYMQVTVFRVGLGSEQDLAALLRARKASMDSINLDRPDIVYQVLIGAPAGTIYVFTPLSSLKTLDEGVSRSAAAYLRSTGSPSPRTATVQGDISQENLLFRVNPHHSFVPADYVEIDPAFWRPRQ